MCGAKDHHDKKWLVQIEESEKALKELGIVDIEKHLSAGSIELLENST